MSVPLDERAQRAGRADPRLVAGAEADGARGWRHVHHGLGRQQAVRAAVAIERVGRHARRVGADEAEGGGRVAAAQAVGAHALLSQGLHEAFAEEAARDGGQQRHGLRQARQAHREVEGRAADARVQAQAGGRARHGEHVEEGFSADEEHAVSGSGRPRYRSMRAAKTGQGLAAEFRRCHALDL